MKKFSNIFYRVLRFIAVVYVVLCAMLYFTPEFFFYHPSSKASDINNAIKEGYRAEVVEYQSEDGTDLVAWYTKPQPDKKVILFLHGNAYNIEMFYFKLIPLAQAGYGTFLPEYRGFGGLKGEINQKNLNADSVAAVKQLHKLGYQNKDIIVYGFSLGSHTGTFVVHELGQVDKFAALILEVPFDSLQNVVKTVVPFLPVNSLVRDKYDNMELIKNIHDTPLLIQGGREDSTIPIYLAENLYSIANQPKDIIIYEGAGHNDLYNYKNYRDILKWLERNEKE